MPARRCSGAPSAGPSDFVMGVEAGMPSDPHLLPTPSGPRSSSAVRWLCAVHKPASRRSRSRTIDALA